MPRFRRLTPPGTLQHLITRFARGEFRLRTRVERDEYIRRFGEAIHASDWRALAYGTMDNHFHGAAIAGNDPPASFMSRANTGMATWLNLRQRQLGPVFSGRFRNVTIDAEYVARLLAYIHNNPPRAHIVDDPADTDRTSHRAYIGLVQPPAWLDVELGLSLAGFDSSPSGRLAFHDYVRSRSGDPRDPLLSGLTALERRASGRISLGAPVEACTPIVTRSNELTVPFVLDTLTPVRPRWPGPLEQVLASVSASTGVSIEAMRSRDRRREVVSARRLMLVVGAKHLGRSQAEVAACVGLSRSAASQLLRARAALEMDAAAAQLAARIRREFSTEKAEN